MDEPRQTARSAAENAGVEIRPLTTLEEAGEVVRLQVATWGEAQTVPREAIRALQGAGVPPLGAYADDDMIGFVLGFIGAGPDGIHVHSHMLAVDPDRRSHGVGRALKLAQRALALGQGITVARWTFDPLIARNAHFNLHVLGAVADRFHRHYYGDMTDRINTGERTDRLEVWWDLRREPGPRLAADPAGEVEVPPDHESLRRTDPAVAGEWRERVADALEEALAGGLAVTGFVRSSYVLSRGSNS
ncbi:MAG: GNAT family N-acetyltransferase [Actinomycetota bacterium]